MKIGVNTTKNTITRLIDTITRLIERRNEMINEESILIAERREYISKLHYWKGREESKKIYS